MSTHPRRTASRAVVLVLSLLLGLVTTVATGLATAAPAAAIVGGADDNGRHPEVALIASYQSVGGRVGRARCTATLVTPRMLVTAAHCLLGLRGSVAVSFDRTIAQDAASSTLPGATTPAAGYTPDEVTAAGWLPGTGFTHPDFRFRPPADSVDDVGVVVLDQPVNRRTAQLAPVSWLETAHPDGVAGDRFTVVGYGVTSVVDGVPQQYPILRKFARVEGLELTPQYLVTEGAPAKHPQSGGACYGDSGGPVFDQRGGYLVAVVSFGATVGCGDRDVQQRVDLPEIEAWLAPYVAL